MSANTSGNSEYNSRQSQTDLVLRDEGYQRQGAASSLPARTAYRNQDGVITEISQFEAITCLLRGVRCSFAKITYARGIRVECGQLYTEILLNGKAYTYGDIGISTNLASWTLLSRAGQPIASSLVPFVGRQDVSSLVGCRIVDVWFESCVFTSVFEDGTTLMCVPYEDCDDLHSMVDLLHAGHSNYALQRDGQIQVSRNALRPSLTL